MTTDVLIENCRRLAKSRIVLAGAVQDTLEKAADEIERLQAIVSHLPTTADGVPISPGATVWTTFDDGPVHVGTFHRGCATGVWIMDTDRGNRTERECYSTAEAAQKARER